MEFRILGPLEVHDDGGALSLGPIKPRVVLAVLLLHPNEPVSAERLALALWGDEAPADATRTVQVYVSRLRKALGDPNVIARTPAGYRLRVRPGELDAERFDRGVEAGRRALAAGLPEQAGVLLREALGLWRGPPLAELEFERFAQVEIAHLEEQRLAALEARVRADLRTGRHAALVGELRRLVDEYPTRERFAAHLMLALYRGGRQAEALEVYREARRILVDDVGIEPGLELQRLHQAVLEHDPSLDLRATDGDLPPALDADTAPPLVGRDAELARLREHWHAAQSGAGRLVIVCGPEGIGKTRLAAELAGEVHRAGGAVEYVVARGAPGAVGAVLGALREAQRPTLVVLDDADGVRDELIAALSERTRGPAGLAVMVVVSSRESEALSGLAADEALVLRPLTADTVRELAPGADPHALRSAILVHDPARNPPPSAATRRRALPLPPNRTIGRGREIGALAERLRAEHVRLLTLTGPGGVGKTRLALEAARAVAADYADGAHLVSLADVTRPQDVPPAIVDALAIIPLAGESAEQAVERFLAAKHLLLVVDNCEHLPAAAPFIGGLSGACPDVTVLTTSREPLAVHAEQCHPVPPLALPKRTTDADTVARADAVALFCERARAHDPTFNLSAGNVEAVAEICRRVDGLPLGIELAAARSGLLSPAEIRERLRNALAALGAGSRDAPARQRTLRATLDWSHGLLNADEQAGFARFAVFAGGATVSATESITGAGIDTLDQLVGKSLLVRRPQADGSTRLGMLETVRAYASERFATAPDCESVRDRHFHYFLSLAQRHGTDQALFGPRRDEHFCCLDRETENLRAALKWASGRDTASDALELSAALIEFWHHRDRNADAVAWVEQALRKPSAAPNSALRVRALCKIAWPLWALGRGTESLAVLAQAEAIARTLGSAILAEALWNRAAFLSSSGHPDAASSLADEALSCATDSGDAWTIAMAAWARSLAASSDDELRERVEYAASRLEEVGNAYHLADLFHMAGLSLLRAGRDQDATRYLQRAVPLARQLREAYPWMLLRTKVGVAALFTGEIAAAHDAFGEALTLSRNLVVLSFASLCLDGLAAVAALDDDLDRAARLAGAAAAHRAEATDDTLDARLRAAFLEPARAASGARAWDDVAAREGAALTIDEAIEYALEGPRSQSRIPTSNATIPAGPHH